MCSFCRKNRSQRGSQNIIVVSYEEKGVIKALQEAVKEAEINNEMLRSKDIWILINTCNWQVGRREKRRIDHGKFQQRMY